MQYHPTYDIGIHVRHGTVKSGDGYVPRGQFHQQCVTEVVTIATAFSTFNWADLGLVEAWDYVGFGSTIPS